MVWDLRTKDGIVIRGIPDDVSQDDAKLKEKVLRIRAGNADMRRMADPTAGTGFLQRFNEGMGKAFTDIGRGASQLVGKGPTAEETQETKRLDAPLMNTGGGLVGNIAGNIAALAPLAVLPGGATVAGAGALGMLSGGLQPTESAGERLTNMGGGFLLGGGTQAAAGPVARRVGEWAGGRQAASQAQQSQNAVRDETLRRGREAGYVVPPSAVNPTATNRIIESIGGKAAVGQQAAAGNAPVTDALARRVGGLTDTDPLSVEALRAARQRMAEPYRQTAALSQQAADDLAALQQARFDSKQAWKEYNRQGARSAYNDAAAADQRVAQLTTALENHANQAGRPELVQALQQARQDIARNHLVQESVNRGAGHADPAVFGKALDRGVPLTGDAQTIGRMHQAFPQFMKDTSGQQAPGTNQLLGVLSGGLGAGGYAAGGLPGIAAGALPFLLPPVARNAALSRAGQSLLGTPNYSSGLLTREASSLDDPETQRLLGLLSRSFAFPLIPQAVNE